MMIVDQAINRGKIVSMQVVSEVLKTNMLGDSPNRRVDVYIPYGHSGVGLPLLVDLVGYTAGGPTHTAWKNFGENVPERLDKLIALGDMQPCVVAFPDCFTRLGGNQYINSLAMGRWEDFLVDEMLPQIENQYQCGGFGKRGVFGKSSGGFAALSHGLRRSDIWSGIVCHSGDNNFEMCYLNDMPGTLRALAKFDNDIEAFIKNFENGPKFEQNDIHTLMILCMAATYDPDPDAFCGIRLPVDLHSCELIKTRWENWQKHDPLRLLDDHVDNLKSLKAIWIDCGDQDQFNLLYPSRQMHQRLNKHSINHEYQEFSDQHFAIDYRMDKSLVFLANKLAE